MTTVDTDNFLDASLAETLAGVSLRSIGREYPNKLDHVLTGPQDLRSPKDLHPVFYGSFDWHSCVHGYWTLARLRRLFPSLATRELIEGHFDRHLTAEAIGAEIDYFRRPMSRGFERPYGWAWLLALAQELAAGEGARAKHWQATLLPLAELIAERFGQFLTVCRYPIRAGTHANTAFAAALAWGYARTHADQGLQKAIDTAVRQWYGDDADCQAWEPSLDDFLSPALMEAECMRRVLPPSQFAAWMERFLPRLAMGEPLALFRPPILGDPSDGKMVHLDGLSLSRTWCFRGLAVSSVACRERLQRAAADHWQQGCRRIQGDYMGEHWLATFALLAAGPIDD